MNYIKISSFSFIVIFLSGNCAALQMNLNTLKKCEVRAKNLQIKEMDPGLFGKQSRLVLKADLEIKNPNPHKVTLYKFNLKLFKKDVTQNYYIASMKSNKTVKIPAHGTRNTSFLITTPAGKKLTNNLSNVIASMIRDIAAGKAPVFLIVGKVQLKSGFGQMSVPVKIEQKVGL